jgi:hypothetical protein
MVSMQRHINNTIILLFDLKFQPTRCGGEALKVQAMIPLEERVRKLKEGFIMLNMT